MKLWMTTLPLVEFSYNNNYHKSISMTAFEVLYGRICRYLVGWFEVCESLLFSPKWIYDSMKIVHEIKDLLKTAYSRKCLLPTIGGENKSLKKLTRCIWKFDPWMGWWGLKRKGIWILDIWFPFKFLWRVGKVEYDLRLPSELALLHPVFHVSMLKKVNGDPECIILIRCLRLEVLWMNYLVKEATWLAEADMESRYSHLFAN